MTNSHGHITVLHFICNKLVLNIKLSTDSSELREIDFWRNTIVSGLYFNWMKECIINKCIILFRKLFN